MIQNVVFDMGNVLVDYQPQRFAGELLRDPEAARAVVRELFEGPEWKLLDAGAIEEDDAVAKVQARIPQYADDVSLVMDRWYGRMEPMPGMPELVGRLKGGGYRLFLLSNTSLQFYRFRERFGLFRHFDGFVVSAKEKLVKPDPDIFRLLCGRYALLPQECLFVDDLAQNVEAAERVGFRAHRFVGAAELEDFLKESGILS